jgi:hypothetical protein
MSGPSSYGRRLGYGEAQGKLETGAAMMIVLSKLDSFPFDLACGHEVVLGRLNGLRTWTCGQCGKPTDLTREPFKAALANMLRIARNIDNQERESGKTITRAS